MSFVVAAACLLIAVELLLASPRGGRKRDVSLWVAGSLALSAGAALLYLRGSIPPFLSSVASAYLLFCGYALFYAAIQYFQRGRVPRLVTAIVLAQILVFTALWLLNPADSHWRAIYAALAEVAWLGATASTLLARTRKHGRTHRLTAVFFIMCAGSYLGIALFRLLSNSVTTFVVPDAASTIFLAALFVSLIGMSFGFQLMIKERADEELVNLATLDSLTMLPNRRAFMQVASDELNRYRARRLRGSLLMIDIDHFKRVNDMHGHLTGDRVLVAFAETLKSVLRPVDVVCRYGGEEFCVLLPETDTASAIAVAERIRERAEQKTIDAPAGPLQYTVSIGITDVTLDLVDLAQLIGLADEALYEAKARGRNCVVTK
ncbi:MAG: GGDEF domain-containing protein [Candidatus Eremiobacteraeota bacterium]|nr:GGDEF domain-containing protein [Candidatus Eremiobacteraeota bacterium]